MSIKRIFLLLSIPLLLGLSIPLRRKLESHRESPGLKVTPPLKPGEFVGTLLLGGLRALAVDLLWVRAEKLRLQGKYFEELTLLNLLAELQPHLPVVWEANGYNLAYNISLSFREKEKQWQWVRKAILFLKKGLKKNPNNPYIEKQLAFFFWHRLNQTPRGRRVRNPYYPTYFRKVFAKDKELNPQQKPPYYHSLYWSRRAVKHFEKEDPVADTMLLDSMVLVVIMEKKKKTIPNLREEIDKVLLLAERLKETNGALYDTLRKKIAFLYTEKALLLIKKKQYRQAQKELANLLKRFPFYNRARQWKAQLDKILHR